MQRGVPLVIVQRILRHASLHTTNRHYVHLTTSDLTAAMEIMDDALRGGEKRG